ncbi:MAG: MotA/TolQ/ExbB proton channel family protein [Spongiibacter sp.]|uniref:MotA/TolQ/ExbB proton channel family protein n=1 Tax=Spongiibacter thalassae TaxID=2721624 RepID=A0ABX1GFQ9_9GAMM|nr:MotA/TolQ/ExbB proton channel family protein [Spongiibacter thalassae]MDX1505276.1 MotA/TolQ/ExbB proton channel family protein [Spongiibacter sp.]NKI17378.1 MotA/TolQ/ExbB proton channel family protein [Spongiibacter thalassae]
MELIAAIAHYFELGGSFMYPIAVVLAVATAIALERLIFLGKAIRENRRFWSKVAPLIASGDLDAVDKMTSDSSTAVAKILARGLEQSRIDSRRSEVEIATEEGLMELLPAIERRTHYLATFSNAATLLGLLGTVIGLITAFSALGGADPIEKANMLSAGISEAMSCTAFGLMVAIPTLLMHAYLQSQTTELIDTLESACSRLVSTLCRKSTLG